MQCGMQPRTLRELVSIAGIGAGMGIGGAINQAMHSDRAGQHQGGGQLQLRGTGAIPSVMTLPRWQASFKVSEEDVGCSAITAGELKARKIGNAYRISKEALEEYLRR